VLCVYIHAVVIHHSPILLPAVRADHIEQFEDASMKNHFFAADERDDDDIDWRESMSIKLQVCFLRFMYRVRQK
jgi:major membrane immunogen (membrane-anchored lipoprotein)